MTDSIRSTALALTVALVLSGCYKTTVRTGIQPGPVSMTHSKATWINGLVPAAPVDAEEDCGDAGVAIVQTEHSFLNQLLGALTLGIYTPVTVRLICGNSDDDDVEGEDVEGESESEDGEGRQDQ